MRDIHNYIPESHHFSAYSITAFLWLKYVLHEILFPMINFLPFHITTFRSVCMCAVHNMAVFCHLLLFLMLLLFIPVGSIIPTTSQ